MTSLRALAVGGLLAAAVVGCAPVLAPAVPEMDDGVAGFQDCEPPFVFEGDATIAELGISDPRLTHEATLRGHIRVTRDTISHEEFAPPGVPAVIPEGQVLCATWADGSGMAMMLAEPWGPPGVFDHATVGPGSLPVVAIGVTGAVVATAVISWLAFRRGPVRPRATDE